MSNKTYKVQKTGSKIEDLLHKIDVLSKNDIGLNNVDNTSDVAKPVSTLQRQALNNLKLRDERLKYYGDPDIVPTDESCFYFTTDDTTMTAGISMNINELATQGVGEVVLPYVYKKDDKTYIITSVQDSADEDSRSFIKKVILPNTINTIGSYAFRLFDGLIEINIPYGVTSIGVGAFLLCNFSLLISIPSSVINIERDAFTPGPYTNLTCAEDSYADDYFRSIGVFPNYTDEVIKQYVINNGVEPKVITEVTDTLLLTHRQDAHLGELLALKVRVPAAFPETYCSSFNFKSGKTPTSLTYTGVSINWRGDDCDEDGHFVPEPNTIYEVSVKNLGVENGIVARVYGKGFNDTELKLRDERLKYYGDPNIVPSDESLFEFKNRGILNCKDKSISGEIVIPYSYSVDGDTKLINAVGREAFKNATNITNVIFSNIITNLGTYCFEGCTSLTNINLPDGISSLGNYLFKDCTNLISIYIPNSVKNIFPGSFDNCHPDLTITCAEGSAADKYAQANGIKVEYTKEVTKEYVDEKIGDIETALDSIIEIQNSLMGVSE